MVLPICQRVTYCRLVAPVITAVVEAGLDRSTTCMRTLSVWPSGERRRLLDRISMPRWLLPPITGNRASPAGSLSPLTGVFDGPETAVPNKPIPEDWRATVITPAPQWSTNCALQRLGGCTKPFDVSSYTISAAPVLSMLTSKKSARLRFPVDRMQADPDKQMSS